MVAKFITEIIILGNIFVYYRDIFLLGLFGFNLINTFDSIILAGFFIFVYILELN
jgi:hypothetical protein